MIRTLPYILLLTFVITACGLLGGNDNDETARTIVFSAESEGDDGNIYAMNTDGSDLKQLTSFREGDFAVQPDWSPDGSRIAYAASTGETPVGSTSLWVMDANGDNKRPLVLSPLTGRPQLGNNPAWSPDGTKLAFDLCLNCESGGSNYEIFVANLQTGTIDTLTTNNVFDVHPVWSPDGTQIAFTSDRSNPNQPGDIYLIKLNTNIVTRITETGNAGRQIWLPQGNQLIYWTNNNLFRLDLADSTKITLNVNLPSEVGFRPLAISPEGKNILLHTFDLDNPEKNHSLETLNLTDDSIKELTTYPGFNGADWSSQSTKRSKLKKY